MTIKVCVLQPSYEGSQFSHAQYDPPRDLSALLPGYEVEHVFLQKKSVFAQLRQLRRSGFDVFVNLCEGYLHTDVPSIDVIHLLDRLELPYTGPNAELYDPAKSLMKIVAFYAGVAVPRSVLARNATEIQAAAAGLHFPLFVKPDYGGDSLGIDENSICDNVKQVEDRAREIIEEFDAAIIDEYIEGREFSVLVLGSKEEHGAPIALRPLEFKFPPGVRIKTYLLKASQYLPQCNVPVLDPTLDHELRAAACSVFKNFGGVGYSRMDFRCGTDGILRLIDVNFACSVFYSEGSYGTADYILAHDGLGQAGFLRAIIEEGIARHRRKKKCFEVVGDALAGFGIRAIREVSKGEIVFRGEERAQRIATLRHVHNLWIPADVEVFKRYSYPLSDQVRMLWDSKPECWAPQNHSCSPNTEYSGLDVVALRNIQVGEELTLDYSAFCDEHMQPFDCCCGSDHCRGRIVGTPANSVELRERFVVADDQTAGKAEVACPAIGCPAEVAQSLPGVQAGAMRW